MKLDDINNTVFQALSPEVQQQLVSAASINDSNTTIFAAIVIITMLTFAYFSIKLIGEK